MSSSRSRWWIGIFFSGVCLAAHAQSSAQSAAPLGKADFLAANLDGSVSPADDFFQYANGGWLERNPIPPTESLWGIDSLVRDQLYTTLRDINAGAAASSAPEGSDERKIGDFWTTAMDVDKAERLGVRPLERELARIDRVSSPPQALDAAFSLLPLEVDVLFRLFLSQDTKDSQTITVYMNQGGLGLPDRDFYINSDESVEHIRAEYVAHTARTLRLLGDSDAAAQRAASEIMAFETSLAKGSRKLQDLRDPLANYHRMTPAEFTRKHTPSIAWVHRLALWNLHPAYVVVRQPEYFDLLEHVLAETPVRVLKNYLRVHLLFAYADYLSPAFEAENFQFFERVLAGQEEPQARWKRVLDAENTFSYRAPYLCCVASPIGMLVGRRYVYERFSDTVKQRYTRFVEAIEAVYRERIGRLDWMSDATKAKALEKLAVLERKVGYPDKWSDYSTLVIDRGSYCENMMSVARWRFRHMLGWYGKPVDRTEWLMTPQTYNAYYHPVNNEIVLPAAIFTVPGMADADVDDAAAFGYVGAATIGHEITHGFDDQGRKFDARGNLVDWWTEDDAAQFERRAGVMVRQFDAYEPLPGFHINGKASLGENIADYGGILLALDAFKSTDQYRSGETIAGFTPMQRFFLGYAYSWMVQERPELTRRYLLSDVHAPPKWRVIGPLSNVPDFYEAFGVKPNQPMWRPVEDRVSIW
jgi:putative endopeptidase